MTPRDLVTKRVVRRARHFPELDLTPLDLAGLDARDAALASAIDHAVARRWLTLATIVDSRLDRSWAELEPALQAVLLVGTAQLVLMDRLPAHAVINEAVGTAKRLVRPRAGGLVNAVLRRVGALLGEAVPTHDPARRDEVALSAGGARRLEEDVFPADARRRLAQQTSHGDALIDRWNETFGPDRTHALAMHDLVHAPIIVAGLPERFAHCTPHERPGFDVFDGSRDELDRLLAEAPGARVQDPASSRAVEATRGQRPAVIVDACAGKGTKTRQLADLHPDARVIAADIDSKRADVLRRVFAGSERVEVRPYEALLASRPEADLLVLDVPCSNTGVLARRVEAKYRFAPASLERLRDLQRQIVADTLPLLGPTGRLLYTTCSVDPAENDEQVAWIARWHPLAVDTSKTDMPRGAPGETPTTYTDGGFHAVLRRA